MIRDFAFERLVCSAGLRRVRFRISILAGVVAHSSSTPLGAFPSTGLPPKAELKMEFLRLSTACDESLTQNIQTLNPRSHKPEALNSRSPKP